MHGKTSLAVASMAVVAMFATPVQAAIVAQWHLDEDPIALDSTIAADTTASHPGQYLDASFFATGAASSVTGHDGTPHSAVQFNKDAFGPERSERRGRNHPSGPERIHVRNVVQAGRPGHGKPLFAK